MYLYRNRLPTEPRLCLGNLMGMRPVGAAHLGDGSIGPSPGSYVVDVLLAVWWSCVTQAAVSALPAAVSRSDCAHVSADAVRLW
jgi:hypothetical protein